MSDKIWLSPPHLSGNELAKVQAAFNSNWISNVGPQVEEFESKLKSYVGRKFCLATNSGTSALHLALLSLGVESGDTVICPTFTFAASAFPIKYCGATPVFVDCEPDTWNLDPRLLEEAILYLSKKGRLPKAVIVVHLYGNPGKIDEIFSVCKKFDIAVIEDAAESLGATYRGIQTGSLGDAGIFSFNGNKIITTSGGGALVTNHKFLYNNAGYYANQANEKGAYYNHKEVGYNYRMSNLLAAVGTSQLEVISERVAARREVFKLYREDLKGCEFGFQQEDIEGFSNRWLSAILTKNENQRNQIVKLLEENNIESRFLMKPMHLQQAFSGIKSFLNNTSEMLFSRGVCLPSGSSLTNKEVKRICRLIKEAL